MKKFVLLWAFIFVLGAFAQVSHAQTPVLEAEGVTIVEDISDSDENFLKVEQDSLSRYDSEFLVKQENASLNYQKLMDSYTTIKHGATVYPDYYGGSYIDDEGNLIIYVKESAISKDDVSKKISQILETNDFFIKSAEYSYNELNYIMDTLNDFKLNNPNNEVANNFNLFWLSDRDNNIVVELDDMSEEETTLFKENVLDSPIITFKESSGPTIGEVNVNPGSRINSSLGSLSVGYRARRSGVNGIVTAAHGVTLNGTINISGTTIGRVTARQNSGTVDAAFIQITNSNYTPTNILQGTSNTLSTTTSKPGVGTVINKSGYVTGATSGKVLSTNVTVTTNQGVTLRNLTSADYSSASGDSGGIVYSYISSTNTRLTLGIHHGSSGTTRFYVKADEINSALGLVRY